ncbi:uncharacterized protein METZ01_LOCUS476542, partial [marine metagenome]
MGLNTNKQMLVELLKKRVLSLY